MDIDQEMYDVFIEETAEQIERIEQDILKLEQDNNEEIVKEIYRMVHSIKGSAASMGFGKLSEFAHDIENLLDKIKKKSIDVTVDIISLLFSCVDKLKELRDTITFDDREVVDLSEIKNMIAELSGQDLCEKKVSENSAEQFNISEYDLLVMDDAAKKGEKVYVIKVEIQEDCFMRATKAFLVINNIKEIGQVLRVWPENYANAKDDEFGYNFKFIIITSIEQEKIKKNIYAAADIKDITIEDFKGKGVESKNSIDIKVDNNVKDNSLFRTEKRSSIRVDISKLDKLMGLVGEWIIDKERLMQVAIGLKQKFKRDPHVQELLSLMNHLDYLSGEVQESIVSARVYTVENVFNRFSRMVRDLSNRSGKQIDFIIEGKNTELDRGILEEIVDPLVHLLRNSIDHGIESIDERIKKGKSPTGTISLRAIHTESNVVIEICDDGKGLDIELIKQKALDKNLINQNDADKMSQQEIINLIFLSGFSTANVITDISGRGIGMDVVKTNIEKLNGIIEVESEKDKGCRFLIKLPLTLAIIQGLIVKQDNVKFVIPLSSVVETVRLTDSEIDENIKKINNNEVLVWRDDVVPIIRFSEYFSLGSLNNNKKVFLVVVSYFDKVICFMVDSFLGEQQIVIKNIGEYLGKGKILGEIKGISGATILPDAKFGYIVDIPEIIKYVNSKHK